MENIISRSSRLEMFLRKGVLEICSKFTGEQPCRSVISIKLLCNFIEIALRHGCSPVNLLHIFRTAFPRNASGWLLLNKANPWRINYVGWTVVFIFAIFFNTDKIISLIWSLDSTVTDYVLLYVPCDNFFDK